MPFIFGPGTGGRIKAIILKKKKPGTNIPDVNTDPISLFALLFPQNMTEILNISLTSYMSFCLLSLPQAG